MTKPAKQQPNFKPDLGTKERRAKGDVRITGIAKSERQSVSESSVERIAAQKGTDGEPKLSERQVSAAGHYYKCAAAYGVFGRYVGIDMAKEVFGVHSDDGAEWLEDLKQQYIQAADCVSPRYKQAMHAIIFYDYNLTEAGKLMGGKGNSAGDRALPMLKDTLDRLADCFKITVGGKERDYKKHEDNRAA